MVVNGLGLTVLPIAAIKEELNAGVLVQLPWQGVTLDTNAYLLYHKDKWLSHGIQAFIRLVRERLLK